MQIRPSRATALFPLSKFPSTEVCFWFTSPELYRWALTPILPKNCRRAARGYRRSGAAALPTYTFSRCHGRPFN